MIKSNKNLKVVTSLLNVDSVIISEIRAHSFLDGVYTLTIQDYFLTEELAKYPLELREALLTEEDVDSQKGSTHSKRMEQALLNQFNAKCFWGSSKGDWFIDAV